MTVVATFAEAKASIRDILCVNAGQHLSTLAGRCSECGRHVPTQRHRQDCSLWVPLTWSELSEPVTWRTFRLPWGSAKIEIRRVTAEAHDVEEGDAA